MDAAGALRHSPKLRVGVNLIADKFESAYYGNSGLGKSKHPPNPARGIGQGPP